MVACFTRKDCQQKWFGSVFRTSYGGFDGLELRSVPTSQVESRGEASRGASAPDPPRATRPQPVHGPRLRASGARRMNKSRFIHQNTIFSRLEKAM